MGVTLQDPLNFTVAIQDARMGDTVGTGVAVSADGKIITCAHVVESAGVKLSQPDGYEVGILFQKTGDKRKARVICCFKPEEYEDDFVLLQLVDGVSPLGPEQVAVLGYLENARSHNFSAIGYSLLGKQRMRWIDGKIMGPVPIDGRTLRTDVYELRTRDIRPGHSGAAILDTEDNLVVGIVTSRWNPMGGTADDNIGHGTDALLLGFEPFEAYGIELRDEPLGKASAPQPRISEEEMIKVRRVAQPQPDEGMRRAPALLEEWVGRDELLDQLTADYNDPDLRIAGLIGFGGEGKSSLARQWIDSVEVDGVFWWGFYDNREVEQFFEAALTYLAGPELTAQVTSTSVRAGIIAQLLREKRYIFVLDGFEVTQHQEGDRYGQIASREMIEFLGYLAGLEHNSFCLITTRTPLLEMMKYTSYQYRDVDRLSEADGLALLRKQGVKGTDDELKALVNTWDGHALTVSLLGAYIGETLGGDLSQLDEEPLADETRYERVYRILRRYDEYLGEAEKAFLTLFSAFRTPVKVAAFPTVFRPATDATALNAPIVKLSDEEFEAMIERLRGYRILRYDPAQQHYTTHPLIREHYIGRFNNIPEEQKNHSHNVIKEHYMILAREIPYHPSLEDYVPLIEAIHHACCAGSYDEAAIIYWGWVNRDEKQMLTHILGAYETALALIQSLFPQSDFGQEPLVSDLGKQYILNEAGFCLMNQGRLVEATVPYKNAVRMGVKSNDWYNASAGYQNLAELHAYLGEFEASAVYARKAREIARHIKVREKRQRREGDSWARLGWAEHLRGKLSAASNAFRKAEVVLKRRSPHMKYLYSTNGVFYAEYRRRVGDIANARRMIVSDPGFPTSLSPEVTSLLHCVLGNLDLDAGEYLEAHGHYNKALHIARSITKRNVLIDALIGLGRLLARHPQPGESARPYLDEALGYCLESGYRIYEADCRVALAWMHHTEGSPEEARSQAERAKAMSAEMGYHWGVVDAEELLAVLL